MENVKNACRGQLCKKAKLPAATLPICTVKITNYYKRSKTLKKALTSSIIKPERKDGANHENKKAYKKTTGKLKSER